VGPLLLSLETYALHLPQPFSNHTVRLWLGSGLSQLVESSSEFTQFNVGMDSTDLSIPPTTPVVGVEETRS